MRLRGGTLTVKQIPKNAIFWPKATKKRNEPNNCILLFFNLLEAQHILAKEVFLEF